MSLLQYNLYEGKPVLNSSYSQMGQQFRLLILNKVCIEYFVFFIQIFVIQSSILSYLSSFLRLKPSNSIKTQSCYFFVQVSYYQKHKTSHLNIFQAYKFQSHQLINFDLYFYYYDYFKLAQHRIQILIFNLCFFKFVDYHV